ncbi:MAG: uracil-DNA glycosylase [Alphaproteobacteria bacterium]|nr:uracil-DNA glycosylase [Alphaproteobacteria bacterium]
MAATPPEPPPDCLLCPRLAAFRHDNAQLFPDWHNAPVPAFGSAEARLLVVGLAPGLRGANRTGRPFTGDYAGDLLYAMLIEFGYARGRYGRAADDGLELVDCRITNGVRCVPPENKPVGSEIKACRPFLAGEIAAMPNLRVILSLGLISHNTVLAALNERPSAWKFVHGARHALPGGPILADSYHCSRYNTNTGRLTEAMFRDVFTGIGAIV